MRCRTFRSACSTCFTVGVLALLVVAAVDVPAVSAQPPAFPQDCFGVHPGGPCKFTQDTNPNDCFVPRCIEGRCEKLHPAPGGSPCDDQDGNPCTTGACIGGEGQCGPDGHAPDGTACPDTDGNPCTLPRCQQGECFQGESGPSPPMDDVASVQVEARPLRVDQDEAFNDCCLRCAHQSLEALRPTPNGPERREPDGGLPLRQKLCGTVAGYGVNDELADPRDILINIEPSPGFEHFVAGYFNTECTPPTSEQKDLFGKGDSQCPKSQCLAAVKAACQPCIHAEVTPAQQFYGKDGRFLPIMPDRSGHACESGWDCNSALEPAKKWVGGSPPGGQVGQGGRKVCVFGVYAHDHGEDHRPRHHRELCCSPDTSHDRPEIHPFDAIWFLHPSGRPGWMFGVFQDDSNRYSFPHCGRQNNGNTWSQAPRDLTFRFPFRFPRSQTPLKACLRHTVTVNLAGDEHEVLPINVTTRFMPDPLAEVKTLPGGGVTLLEAVEPAGLEDETQVRIDGCVTPTEIQGTLTLRVAVGCPRGASCPGLVDRGDPGSGFYYAEITFQPDCQTEGGVVLGAQRRQ